MLAEFALVSLTLFFMLIGTIDVGMSLWRYTTISRAVTIAARCAAIKDGLVEQTDTSLCPDDQAFIKASAIAIDTSKINFTFSPASCGIQVNASYISSFILIPVFTVNRNEAACFTSQKPSSSTN